MKLAQLLAKELKEWPEGAKYARQDFDGEICFVGRDIWSDFYASCVASDIYLEDGIGASQITEDQWQAEREKMNKPKWIRHRGGKCPVSDGVDVTYRLRGGYVGTVKSEGLMWDHQKDESDLMAYYVEETKDQEIEEVIPKHMAFGYASKEEMVEQIGEECPFAQVDSTVKNTNIGTLTCNLEIDATEATKEIDILVAKWGQIESPLKWRDEIIELEAYEEEFRREREKLIRKLESEGFKLIDHINCNLDKIDQTLDNSSDMSDWRNWRAGDTVECLVVPGKHTGYYFSGENYNIRCVDLDDEGTSSEVDIYCAEGFSLWCPSSSFKFVSRP